MKKIAWFLIGIVLISLSACHSSEKTLNSNQDQSKIDSKNELIIQLPQRIITLSPHLTELVYSLNQEHRLIATVAYSDYPEAAKQIPRIGNAFQIDWEKLIELEPDLVIGWQNGNPESILKKIENLEIKLLRLENAKLFALPEQLNRLSKALNGEPADNIGDEYLQGLFKLKEAYAKKKNINVFYLNNLRMQEQL